MDPNPSSFLPLFYDPHNSTNLLSFCQNLGAASSNRVRTSQDTMDVDNVLGNIR